MTILAEIESGVMKRILNQ